MDLITLAVNTVTAAHPHEVVRSAEVKENEHTGTLGEVNVVEVRTSSGGFIRVLVDANTRRTGTVAGTIEFSRRFQVDAQGNSLILMDQ